MKRLLATTVLVTVTAVLALSATATAQVVLGEVAPGTPTASCGAGPYDGIPGGTNATGLYRVPANGVISSWSTNAAAGAGQELAFKVFRPLGGNRYLVVGHDGPNPLIPGSVNTFDTNIAVHAGDLIGENDANASAVDNACEFPSATGTDLNIYPPKGNSADGTTVAEEGQDVGYRENVRATLLPSPTISSISPASGPLTGGTSVLISGANFTEVTGVVFGTTPAPLLVKSESQISVTAPPSAAALAVPVTVTTRGGTALSPQAFTYAASAPPPPAPTCKVPKLNGKTLKSAKKRIRAAECRVGKLTRKEGATAKDGEVVKQVPKPGVTVPAKTKVKVTLAP